MLLPSVLAAILTLTSVEAAASPALREDRPTIRVPNPTDTAAIESAKRLGVIFPPGYPQSAYEYHVRYSDIELVCPLFEYAPQMNEAHVETLLRRLIRYFIDPKQRDNPLETDVWYEPIQAPMEGASYASVIFLGSLRATSMTHGKFLNVLIGMNHIRLNYPKLTFTCIANQLKPAREHIGGVRLDYQAPPGGNDDIGNE
ncbi:hypothetical protein XANCAGTX0491_000862 [Xanthoria calcicola]